MKNLGRLVACLLLLFSCSTKKVISPLKNKSEYNLTDSTGKYILKREVNIHDKNEVILKRIIENKEKKILEKSFSVSKIGKVGNVKFLRPKESQFEVWFDGKRYQNLIKINPKTKKLILKLSSPESQWNGEREYLFPNTKKIYCFYHQVVECLKVSDFFTKAIKNQGGKLKIILIWDGYPYFQEQYVNINKEIFQTATLKYDGKNKSSENRFSLSFSNQTIFYIFTKNGDFKSKFWVAQGLSQSKI